MFAKLNPDNSFLLIEAVYISSYKLQRTLFRFILIGEIPRAIKSKFLLIVAFI